MLQGCAPRVHRPEAQGDEGPRARPAWQWRRFGERGREDSQHVCAEGHHAGKDPWQDEAHEQRLQDHRGAYRHGDAHRGDGERRDGIRQRDNVGRNAGPRPCRGARHQDLRQGSRAGSRGPALQRAAEANHRKVLYPQQPLHPGNKLQARPRRIHGAYTRQPDQGVPHAQRPYRARRRRHQARHRGEARLAAQHRLLSERERTRLHRGDARL